MPASDGYGLYPTDEELLKVEEWKFTKDFETEYHEFMAYARSLWYYPDYVRKYKNTYTFITGGWSGNEDVIGAMQKNKVFWAFAFYSEERGGKFVFRPIGD